MDFLQQLKEMVQEQSRDYSPDMDSRPDVMKAAIDRIKAPCPFKVGQLITPLEGFGTKGVGRPCMVVEVFEPRLAMVSNQRHEYVNMAITVGVSQKTAVIFLSASSEYEAWDEKKHGDAFEEAEKRLKAENDE